MISDRCWFAKSVWKKAQCVIEDMNIADDILEISITRVFDVNCFKYTYVTFFTAFTEKLRVNHGRYKGRHLIPMFIGTRCIV